MAEEGDRQVQERADNPLRPVDGGAIGSDQQPDGKTAGFEGSPDGRQVQQVFGPVPGVGVTSIGRLRRPAGDLPGAQVLLDVANDVTFHEPAGQPGQLLDLLG